MCPVARPAMTPCSVPVSLHFVVTHTWSKITSVGTLKFLLRDYKSKERRGQQLLTLAAWSITTKSSKYPQEPHLTLLSTECGASVCLCVSMYCVCVCSVCVCVVSESDTHENTMADEKPIPHSLLLSDCLTLFLSWWLTVIAVIRTCCRPESGTPPKSYLGTPGLSRLSRFALTGDHEMSTLTAS